MSDLFKDAENGLTIIEMIVSLVIGILILGIALSLFYVQRKSFSIQEQLTEMQQNMRVGMDIMSREIRMAGYLATGTTAFSLTDTGTVTFNCDIDGDDVAEQIRYGLDRAGLQIERRVNAGVQQPITENIVGLSFVYGTDATTGNTNTVTIAITARTEKSDPSYKGDGYRMGTLTSIIDIRNE